MDSQTSPLGYQMGAGNLHFYIEPQVIRVIRQVGKLLPSTMNLSI